MHPDKAYIVVVGNPEVKGKLERFGKIFEYDLDLNPMTGEKAKLEPVKMSGEEIISKYLESRGGKDFLQSVKTIVSEGNAELQAQGQTLKGKILLKIKSPLKKYELFDFGMFQSEVWHNNDKSWAKVQSQVEELKFKEVDKNIFDIAIEKDIDLLTKNFKVDVLGKQNGKILVKFTTPRGFESTVYFDEKTYLIDQIEGTEESPQGPIPVTSTFAKWDKVGNFLFPTKIKTTNPMFTIETEYTIKINEELDDSIFQPSK